MKALIQKLVETPGPPGYESAVRALVRAEIEAYAAEIQVDGLGSLIARVGQGRPRLALLANLDEPGLIADHITRDGLIRFQALGGLEPGVCAGQRVRFINGTPGVIGFAAPGDSEALQGFRRLAIDIGARDPEALPVKVGDPAVLDAPFVDLGDRIAAKALDNRLGVMLLIETLRKLADANRVSDRTVYFVFSAQETVGLRGAAAAGFRIEADLALAVDVTDSRDALDAVPGGVRLGGGVVIRVRDGEMLGNPRLIDWMIAAAEEHTIPYQLEVRAGSGAGARAVQMARSGTPAAVLAAPCRYRGSPSGVVDLGDVQAAADLLAVLVQSAIPFPAADQIG